MVIRNVRDDLIAAREDIKAGNTTRALEQIEHAIGALDIDLFTTSQAKEILQLGSVNTVKLLVKNSNLPYNLHGNRMMIPRSTLEELQKSQLLRGLRASDDLHAQSAGLGPPEGLTQEQLDDLEELRAGVAP